MKLIANLTIEEVKKIISGYVKKKTGKHVEDVQILPEEVIVELGVDESTEE